MRDRASFGERDQDFVVIHIVSERASSHANGDIQVSVEHTALEFSEGTGLEIPESCVLFELRRLDETSSGHR